MRAVIPCGCTSTSAPICWRALTWKSTGRRPMRSPPTSGTKASWARWSSGPSSRIGMRLRPENSSGTRGVGSGVGTTVIVPPSMSTSRPIDRRMSAVMPDVAHGRGVRDRRRRVGHQGRDHVLGDGVLGPRHPDVAPQRPARLDVPGRAPGVGGDLGRGGVHGGQGTPGPRVVDTARTAGEPQRRRPIDQGEIDRMSNTQRWGAEAFGTFWLVLGGCGTAVIAGDRASARWGSLRLRPHRADDGLRRRAHLRRATSTRPSPSACGSASASS